MRSLLLLIPLLLSLLALAEAARTNDAGRQISRAERVVLEKRKKHHSSKKKGSSKSGNSGNSGNSGMSGSFSGTGTWFIPSKEGGSQGACGPSEADDAPIVAMNAPQYGSTSSKSKWCGKKIRITSGGKSVTATVNDACPGCKFGDLDLTPVLFKKLADLNKGVIDIKWQLI
ncbi:hypothetical protein DFQ28_002890 [Apophysomyces sp. BC1034]|nr:hypothetical protein DFQ30_005656 [Apophysomyces sp. BC1015]KAG0170523.1 hypothetical protein DFQ29_009221 [Apophysomyces sp. BC1021]KAG0189790.1 hypothetical protein DFQ28_002890 [Apophysomyces sp. BC1034]